MFARSRLLYWKTSGIALEVEADLGEVLAEVLRRLSRFGSPIGPLGVGDEDDAVDALEDELPGRVVEDLSRNRVELEAGLEAADDADVEREEVEEERPVGLGLEGDHLAPRARARSARR